MGFVKSPEELAALAAAFRVPSFENAREVSVEFVTDRTAIERILPPGLAPDDEPRVFARVGSFHSNIFGPYLSAGMQVAARHRGEVGRYVVALYTSTHSPMSYGREFFSEPKKDGTICFKVDGDRAYGSVSRHGTVLIDIDAQLGPDFGSGDGAVTTFNYEFRSPWNDLESGSAVLRAARFNVQRSAYRTGTGRLELTGSPDDPLDELPVREIRSFAYFEGRMSASVEDLEPISAEAYLPYAFARYDDWSGWCDAQGDHTSA